MRISTSSPSDFISDLGYQGEDELWYDMLAAEGSISENLRHTIPLAPGCYQKMPHKGAD